MSARFTKVVPPVLSTLALAFAFGTSAAGPWVIQPGEFHSEVRGTFLSAETYFDDQGNRPTFPSGGTYEARSLRWSNELGWKKFASFRLDIPFTSVTRRLGNGPTPEATQTGLSDMIVGFDVKLHDGSTAVSLEADWKAPLGYDRRLFPALGNGNQEAIGLLHLGTEIRPIQGFVQLAGGYRAALTNTPGFNEGGGFGKPSDAVLANADLGFWLGSSVLVSGSYRGRFESSGDFPETSHHAGPQLLYRIDDSLDIFAGSLHTASGKNVIHTDRYYVGLSVKKTRLNRLQGFLGSTKRP